MKGIGKVFPKENIDARNLKSNFHHRNRLIETLLFKPTILIDRFNEKIK